uniref:Diphosphomevalonate decarboxylase n=1 Tax=Heterorhabditis bacteriophora TaxID=37862 RepID=A0A1I7XQ72_HETBA
MDIKELRIEVQVPINIALIKYWGKRDEDLILPLNDSVSLNINNVFAKTLLRCVPSCTPDSVSINGEAVDLNKSVRFKRCFNVDSTTNFPVAAGLASSAAGFAAIAFAIGQLFSFSLKDVSRIARIGSGSACRSVFEGLVHWKAGIDASGSDCYVEQLFPANHWPELRAVIVIFNETKKETGSTAGMKATVKTSDLLKYRVEKVVPERIKRYLFYYLGFQYILKAKIFQYMSDASWEMIRLVHEMNHNDIKAAYTFDAGPNACIFLLQDHVAELLQLIHRRFIISSDIIDSLGFPINGGFLDVEQLRVPDKLETYSIKEIILSGVGFGPKLI